VSHFVYVATSYAWTSCSKRWQQIINTCKIKYLGLKLMILRGNCGYWEIEFCMNGVETSSLLHQIEWHFVR
jgi:hypothetical protein